jgi:DNA-binding CsgD family transcriptional regulator
MSVPKLPRTLFIVFIILLTFYACWMPIEEKKDSPVAASFLSDYREIKIDLANENPLIIFCLGFGMLSFFLVFGFGFKKLNKDLKKCEAEKLVLSQQLSLKTESEEKNIIELETKTKALTALTLQTIQKNELLETIKAEMTELKKSVQGESKEKVIDIVKRIGSNQTSGKDWDHFKLYFERVHHGFFDDLQAMVPGLNSRDLKLCALIKLNMDSRQIASIMHITPESAKVARYRVKRKLGLNSEDNILDFFSSLSREPKVVEHV